MKKTYLIGTLSFTGSKQFILTLDLFSSILNVVKAGMNWYGDKIQ